MRGSVEDLARRLGLMIRPAVEGDLSKVEALARSSFPIPTWLFDYPENRVHYHPTWDPERPAGRVRILVAENRRGGLAAYAYDQIRHDGDVYLRELAAVPPDPRDRVVGAGTLLLHSVLDRALRAGCRGLATLSVIGPHRDADASQMVGWRDPVTYYRQFGYRIGNPQNGYTDAEPDAHPGVTWMTVRPITAHRRTRTHLIAHRR